VSFLLAFTVCALGIAGLFYLDRDRSLVTSKALWLPVIWLWIVGSRPVSFWLGINLATAQSASQAMEGSPVDASVFAFLLAAGITVLISRRSRTRACLKASWPVLIYFAYCLVSVVWSPYPDIAFKRWTKDAGDLAMVLVVATEAEPKAALRRLFSRVGFILLPASVLLIRYSDLGRGYDPDGNAMVTGVSTNKNSLGLITFVLSLGALWSIRAILRARREPLRRRHLLAQGALLAFGVAILAMANSATSNACFGFGAVLMLATDLPSIGRRPSRVHVLIVMIMLLGGFTMLLGGEGNVVHALGRKTDLTGRTDIWKAVIPLCPNPLIGAGFESFWIGPNVAKLWSSLSNWFGVQGLNTPHNGYIEVYLNLGWVGLSLLALIFINGYRSACATFRLEPEVASLSLGFLATAAIYSITEAGFRMLTPTWIALLLAIVVANRVRSGVRSKIPRATGASANQASGLPVEDVLAFHSFMWNN
jgi:exopolysaccharide production protein ExoQ